MYNSIKTGKYRKSSGKIFAILPFRNNNHQHFGAFITYIITHTYANAYIFVCFPLQRNGIVFTLVSAGFFYLLKYIMNISP